MRTTPQRSRSGDGQELQVLGFVDRVVGVGAADKAAAALGHHAVAEEVAHIGSGRQQGHRCVEVSDVHVLAGAGAFAGEEGEHDAKRAMQARASVVGHQVQGKDGLSVGLADEPENPRQREKVAVMCRVVAIRAVLPEA